ncbi:MAG: hypothetical protein IKR29_03410 [Bacteroidales bacterium]|nr:hypothetical protein [Bacteroidales bacterium]
MYKSIKNSAVRILLIVLTVVFGLLIGYWLFVYLITPRYVFMQGKPFHGEYLYNPYKDMDPDQWKQYNFHCHSRRYLGITNGRMSKEKDIDSIYQTLGYDHYGISDYMRINRHRDDQPDYIPAYEHGYGFFRKTHQLCIGAESVVWMDYPFMQSLDMKQHLLNVLKEHARFAVPAHAAYTKGYKVSDMHYLSGYRLLEIGNPYGPSYEHWDAALSTGHRVYGIGDDDTHKVLNSNEVGRYFTMINTGDMRAENVYDALEKGCSYTVEFHSYFGKPFELKVERMHELPHLTRCELLGDTLVVETDAPLIEIAEFIGQDGKVLQHEESLHRAIYVIQPSDTYVRVKLRLPNLTFFYLNPITRHPTPEPKDQHTAQINVPQTILFYIVYVAVIVLCIFRVIRNAGLKKNKK